MVEAGRIDHAGHDNDIAGHLGDMLAYDEAMRIALEFAEREGNTLIVATSDHETGGLSLARDGVYQWYPDQIGRIQASIEKLLDMAGDLLSAQGPDGYPAALLDMLNQAGIALEPEDAERVRAAFSAEDAPSVASALRPILQDLTARQGGVGWSTTGHSGVDVPLFAFGPGMDRFTGTLENDEVGRRLIETVRGAR
jgi:alkaline phosphatase